MDIKYTSTPRITVREIPDGECFSNNNELYIKVSSEFNVELYEELMSVTDEHSDFLAVRLSDGMIAEFSGDCRCTRVRTEVTATLC